MNGTIIKNTSYHNHLGLTFSNSGTWDEHVKYISEKSWSRLNLLRALKFRVSRKSLEKMYFAYIRPLLEYSDVIWDNFSLESKKLLDTVHVEAARVVTGATKLSSIERIFMELGWESLQTRRNKHKLTTFYKIMHGLAPTYLSDLILPIVGQSNNYALRNADHIQGFRSNSNLFSEFFFPSTIKAWNSLPNEVREMTSVSAFKNYLNRNKLQSPYYFHAESRLSQILHVRLRMQCSALHADLYRKNIVESPSCQH